jgi:deuterolysin
MYNETDQPAVKAVPQGPGGFVDAAPSEFQMIEAGESVVRKLEIMPEFELAAGEKYYLQLGGFMPFYHANQKPSVADSQSQIFEADILPFTAPLELPPTSYRRIAEAATVPNVLVTTCSDAEMNAKLVKTIPHGLEQAKKTLAFIKTGNSRDTLTNFFKSNDEATKKVISDRFSAIIKTLEGTTGPGKVGCSEATGPDKRNHQLCVQAGAVAMTDPTSGKVSFCPASKRYPVEFKRCGDSKWGGTLIHELTHSGVVFKPTTQDITYALQGCKALSTARALNNANSFNFLADSAMQGKSC